VIGLRVNVVNDYDLISDSLVDRSLAIGHDETELRAAIGIM